MDFKSLQLFTHLASTLHFGETAQAMFVSPSTLSRAIQRLEDDCGCVLFKRDNRSVALTHSGHKFLTFAQQTLQDWQNLQKELKQDNETLQGELSLYCSVTASQSVLPSVLNSFPTAKPGRH